MKALVSVLIRAAAPGEVITSHGRGATATQMSPASTPSATVPMATTSAATTARTPSRNRQERTASSHRAGSGRGIGTDMVGSSVRDTPKGRRGRRLVAVKQILLRWCAIVYRSSDSGRRADQNEGYHVIEAQDLTNRYGDKLAVDHLSFKVVPGRVTGFLGPNGAGKSTTMRLVLGLDRPNTGTATINGRPYAQLAQPLLTVGALLEAKAMHPGRSARNHLLFMTQTQGLPSRRVDEVLDLVGLREVANQRVRGYSLGMSQRVGIAAAMLGNPSVLLLDEPVNGLDPEGILWIRNLMKHLASEQRTIFVSSHLMNEMAVTADHLIVIGKGKLIADCTTQEFIERSSEKSVLVRSPDASALADLIAAEGGKAIPQDPAGGRAAALSVTGLDAPRIGEIAAANRIVLHELTPQLASLEEAFIELTADTVEYGGGVPATATPAGAAQDPVAVAPDTSVPGSSQ